MAINGLPMPDHVTVLVSTELLAELEADWSHPVQIQVRRTPGIGSGYEMTARTHTCPAPIREQIIGALLDAWMVLANNQTADSPEGHCAALADVIMPLLAGGVSNGEDQHDDSPSLLAHVEAAIERARALRRSDFTLSDQGIDPERGDNE